MAYNISALPTYVEEKKDALIKGFVLDGETVKRIQWMTDVKTSANLNFIDTDPVLQEYACGFDPQGDAVFSNRVLETAHLKWDKEFCKADLLRAWTQAEVRIAADDEGKPFIEQILEDVRRKLALKREMMIWQGNKTSGSGDMKLINGFLQILDADDSTVKVSIASGASAYDAIQQVYLALPAAIRRRDVKINVSPELYAKFTQELVAKNLFHYAGPQDEAPMEIVFPGTRVRVVDTEGLTGTNKIVATMDENLYYGTDLMSDNLEIIESGVDKKAGTWWLKVDTNFGVQVAFPEFAVVGTITA